MYSSKVLLSGVAGMAGLKRRRLKQKDFHSQKKAKAKGQRQKHTGTGGKPADKN